MLHPKRKNEAQREAPPLTPRSQRLETLQKQRIYSAQRSTPSAALRRAQHCTAPSKALNPAQRAKTRPIAASEPSRLRKGGLLRFLCSISAHENRSADTRARSLCLKGLSSIFGALGIPAQPNRVMVVPRNAHKADRSKRTKPVAKTGFVAFSLFD